MVTLGETSKVQLDDQTNDVSVKWSHRFRSVSVHPLVHDKTGKLSGGP